MTRNIKWAGIALILLVGLIHLVDASGSIAESALKGISFYLNAAAAGVAAGAFGGYVVSRTVGIFGLPPDVWMEPIAILSLIVEGLFVMLFAYAALGRRTPAGVAVARSRG